MKGQPGPAEIENIAQSLNIPNVDLIQAQKITMKIQLYLMKIVETAKTLSLASKTSILTVQNIKEALEIHEEEPLYGYFSNDKPKLVPFQLTQEETLLAYYDRRLDVDKLGRMEMLPYSLLPRIEQKVIFKEGIPENQLDTTNESDDTEFHLTEKAAYSKLQYYFHSTIDYLNGIPEMKSIGLHSVCTSQGISSLLHRYLDYIDNLITTNQSDYKCMTKCALLLHAIVTNDTFIIEDNAEQIISYAITICVTNEGQSQIEANIKMRETSALLIGKISHRLERSIPNISMQICSSLKDIEEKASDLALYGILCAYQEIGGDAAEIFLLRRLSEFINLVNLKDEDAVLRNIITGSLCNAAYSALHNEILKIEELGRLPLYTRIPSIYDGAMQVLTGNFPELDDLYI